MNEQVGMKTSLDCVPCLVRQALDAARLVSKDPAVHEKIVREVLHWTSEMALHESPAVLGQRIHRRIREIVGGKDPYRESKEHQNRMAGSLIPKLKAELAASSDPLALAVKLAVAANVIDLGAKGELTEEEVMRSLQQAADEPLVGDMASFKTSVAKADRILYVADNAGEIIIDRLLIEQLSPERVTVAVRGGPIINDATRTDAQTAGLDKIVPVIDNGSDAPGTILEDCSAAFRCFFTRADLIIAKGQGNFETLSDVPRNIFFLFKAKCPVVETRVGLPIGTHMLIHGEGEKRKEWGNI